MTVKSKGVRKTFFTGSNSTCRQHIRQHFDDYKQRCEAGNIQMNQRAIPTPVWKEMTALKSPKKQTSLDEHISKLGVRPSEFSRDAVLDAVAKFVVCDDQVSLRVEASSSLLNVPSVCVVISCCRQSNIQELSCYDETENNFT
jgi:hypothetical protein